MTEPLGDAGRNAAAIIESYLSDNMQNRAVVMITASAEYHAPGHCPMAAVVMILAQMLTDLAQQTDTDLAPALTALRRGAEAMDAGE